MKIGGIQKFSLIDYPGKISAVLFTQGCMFRCKFCHNPELVDPKRFGKTLDSKEIIKFLESRIGKLEAVVISGGEPCIQSDLFEFIKEIRSLGFLVKLDTTGYFPEVVKKLIKANLLDYIAMDIKAPLNHYSKVVSVNVRIERIKESIELIKSSGVDYEFRTTIAKRLTSKENVYKIAEEIKGAKRYILQKFSNGKTLDPTLENSEAYSDEDYNEMYNHIKDQFEYCFIR